MKSDGLPKTSLRANNIPEATVAYAFLDALLTFTFAYGSRSQSANVLYVSFGDEGGGHP